MINLQQLIALAGSVLAAAQALLIVLQGETICLNDGCEIVEQLTTVSPLVFNVVGSLFFLAVFLALWQGGRGIRAGLTLARVLLLAGMAAEGALIGFQYFVAEAFCSYCLTIFGFILLLNLLMGWRQLLAGLAVTGSVLLAFAGLQFVPYSQAGVPDLREGVYGRLERSGARGTLHLFFSSSCPHCEEVIATIDDAFVCSLDFNPIDRLDVSPMEALELTPGYFPERNRDFLKTLGISEIPVLVVKSAEEMRILKGGQAILAYLDRNCRTAESAGERQSELPGVSGQPAILPYMAPSGGEETCSVEVACEEEATEGGGR